MYFSDIDTFILSFRSCSANTLFSSCFDLYFAKLGWRKVASKVDWTPSREQADVGNIRSLTIISSTLFYLRDRSKGRGSQPTTNSQFLFSSITPFNLNSTLQISRMTNTKS
jgi:hypothetical protein